MKNILVLCIGNICRSPLAEALLAKNFPSLNISSAGLSAMVGYPADANSIAVAIENGLDISLHRARQVNLAMCQSADLILVMERFHRSLLIEKFPLTQGKVFSVSDIDVDDPYGKSKSFFDRMYGEVSAGVDAWSLKINKLI